MAPDRPLLPVAPVDPATPVAPLLPESPELPVYELCLSEHVLAHVHQSCCTQPDKARCLL